MQPRTSRKKRRFLKKLLRSSLSLLKTAFKTIFIIVRSSTKYMLAEAVGSFVILGGLACIGGLGSLLIGFGILPNVAFILAIVIFFSLLIAAVYLLDTVYEKRKGEVRFAHAIAKFFANSPSSQWHEYQDWLHDILLARQQLLEEKCPQWRVKLITYRRLTMFCMVVGMNQVKQAVVSMRRSR